MHHEHSLPLPYLLILSLSSDVKLVYISDKILKRSIKKYYFDKDKLGRWQSYGDAKGLRSWKSWSLLGLARDDSAEVGMLLNSMGRALPVRSEGRNATG